MDLSNILSALNQLNAPQFCGPNPPPADPQLIPYTVPAPRPTAKLPVPPIDCGDDRAGLAGKSRRWGDAPVGVQTTVIDTILEESSDLAPEDRVTLLGIARLESGFNPDAYAGTSSASGIFQIVKQTGLNLGLAVEDRFDAKKNIVAGVALFKQLTTTLDSNYPGLHGNQRAVMLYTLYHDGPTLAHGGDAIAITNLVPYLARFRALVTKRG